MEKTLGTAVLPIPPTRKPSARAALVEIKDPERGLLSECFRQLGIEPVALSAKATERFKSEKFEACVIRLSPAAHPVMESARISPSNSRMIIYGLGGNAQEGLQFSRYGINAVFPEPLERHAALKLVRATQMLVLHEFRRYVRIPVITEISITLSGNHSFTATSVEISGGGMSLRSAEDITVGQSLELSFALLTLPRIWVRATVSWRMAGTKAFGVRFDPQDDRRLRIKEWVEAYLEV
jgi:hypothetical protein